MQFDGVYYLEGTDKEEQEVLIKELNNGTAETVYVDNYIIRSYTNDEADEDVFKLYAYGKYAKKCRQVLIPMFEQMENE